MLEHGSRRAHLLGVIANPTGPWTTLRTVSDCRMGVSVWWIVLLRLPYLAVSSVFAHM